MRRAGLLLCAMIAVAGAGCASASDSAQLDDIDVSAWKTWLPSPGDGVIPSGPHAAVAESVREQPLGARWIRLAMDYVSARTKDPPAASRAYALVSVASFDAYVTARHGQATHETAAVSAEAAVAGAATTVLAHVFPEQPAPLLRSLAERVAADASPLAAGSAGLALGRAIGERVVAHAQQDGFERVWDGSRPPHEPRYWDPPPGSVSPPVRPLAGASVPWVLPSGHALRPGPPPPYGSEAFLEEARELVRIGRDLTPAQKRTATFWAGGEGTPLPPGVWNEVLLKHLSEAHAPPGASLRALALVNVAMADAGIAAWDAKYAYWNPRPENAIRDLLDPAWTPYLRTPSFPAYVSGHATYSAAAAIVLTELFPSDADRFRALGEEAGYSRILGGIHYRSDNVEGAKLGRQIGALVVERARAMGLT